MNSQHDNNLSLGLAQMLENLNRLGMRLSPKGTSTPVVEWLANHGTSMTLTASSTPTLTAVPPVEAESAKLDLPPIEPLQKVAPKLTSEKADVNPTSWQTLRLDTKARLELLEQESQVVSKCTRCQQLVCSRTRTVYGVGNVTSRIVFVGEGPGAEEDRLGVPFVGAAGQLLDKIILAMNLKREDVYIMNAVKCRPQNNRTPTDEEIANCQPYFLKQLEAIQPEFIVCLGAVASRAVLQSTLGIGRLRGKFHSFRGARVAVTYHPAYLLRTPEAKKLTWEDMKMVMAAMKLDR